MRQFPEYDSAIGPGHRAAPATTGFRENRRRGTLGNGFLDSARLGDVSGGTMPSLRAADYRAVLELLTQATRDVGPDFPGPTVTESLRILFQADFAGAGEIDFVGTASRRWADSPHPVPASAEEFHRHAVDHPLASAYRRSRQPVPLRLSDVTSARTAPASFGGTGMTSVLTIPLEVASRRVSAIAITRERPDFSTRDLELARELQPLLGVVYTLRDRLAPPRTAADIPLTAREIAILNLMADGLIATAIARRLAISRGTVNKHIEHLYSKLGTHDRTSAVLRGRDLGILAEPPEPHARSR
jgi:DNA-binding CsgD family transcriptional regulator